MTIRVREHVWNRRDHDAQEGAMVHHDDAHVFVPARKLRQVADKLHDIADDIDGST